MARYGGDFGRHFQGMQGYGAGMGRGYGADYGFDRGRDDFRGGFYRGEGRYGAGYRGYPGGEPWGGYDRGYRGSGGGMGTTWAGYGTDFRTGRGGFMGERSRYGGTGSGWRGRQGGGAQMRVGDLMTENPEAVTPDATLADVAKKMKELDVGIIPVVDDQQRRHLEGVITDRDIAIRAVAEGKDGKAKVAECMTREVESCRRDDQVQDILNVMRSEKVRRVPITDEEGCLVGIVAQADLAVEFAGLDRDREISVEEMIERVSEPARPQRGRDTMRRRER
jgi:CBS domain-containing protein